MILLVASTKDLASMNIRRQLVTHYPFEESGENFQKNPIYNKKQEDDRYGIQGTIYYKNPWNWGLFGSNPMNFYLGAAYAKIDANIDFYDQEAFLTTAGVFFKW